MPSLSTPDLEKNRHTRSNQAAVANSGDREVFISRLKEVIKIFGSNSALAREIGSAESTIRRWAAGAVEPKYDSLVAISKAADISLEWLMTGRGQMRESTQTPPIAGEKTVDRAEHVVEATMIVAWDNMEPTLCTGDEIGIEPAKIDPQEVTSGIYILRMGSIKGVWRLQPAADKKIWLLNDNPKYQRGDTSIDLTKAHDIEISARVLWVRHKL
jgi:phage repressor protein C with HTH and peptisase S24 domain